MTKTLSPLAAVDELEALYARAVEALTASLQHYARTREPPSPERRALFRYPELRVTYTGDGPPPKVSRAYGQLIWPGAYTVTVTQPHVFRPYLLEQLEMLAVDYGATISVGVSDTEIPFSFVLDSALGLEAGVVSGADLARNFPHPQLTLVGDNVVDGETIRLADGARPLALFDAPRIDYSLKRLEHYTGTPWADTQPWTLFTNYQRYVDEFVLWALEQVRAGPPGATLSCPGRIHITRDTPDGEAVAAAAPWRKYQMPAYHLLLPGEEGISLVNIGVGPSNAKTITDHLAVLRPHCWLMVGHCGGLRFTQRIGDYVLAHAYLRRDKVLDDRVPLEVPIPAIAEVQVALQRAAAARMEADGVESLKSRLRTGTVVSYADRNWELNFLEERQLLSQSRAVAVDMESACIATQGFRLRVPYGVLLCVSDKPLHGEIKMPGPADRFYEQSISAHLRIGIDAVNILKQEKAMLHSRKLRSFDEPPFR